LTLAFKKVFIPKINNIYLKRNDHVNKYIKGAEVLEAEILVLKEKVTKIKSEELENTSKIIRRAIKSADEVLNNHMEAIKEENEAIINGTRAKFTREMKDLENSMKINVEKIAESVIDRMFNEHI
jgi:F0F1-type ATP synthase membrane subunit b/b'